MPLVLKGTAKKVFALSTGLGEVDFTRENDMWMASSYSVSKAALNMVIAKFSAEFREQGVLFLAISPGVVDTGFSRESLTCAHACERKLTYSQHLMRRMR
jgi:NAD(P)-dependent dehydrogenase (short-subunit alcohol dehydrogenase family)